MLVLRHITFNDAIIVTRGLATSLDVTIRLVLQHHVFDVVIVSIHSTLKYLMSQ